MIWIFWLKEGSIGLPWAIAEGRSFIHIQPDTVESNSTTAPVLKGLSPPTLSIVRKPIRENLGIVDENMNMRIWREWNICVYRVTRPNLTYVFSAVWIGHEYLSAEGWHHRSHMAKKNRLKHTARRLSYTGHTDLFIKWALRCKTRLLPTISVALTCLARAASTIGTSDTYRQFWIHLTPKCLQCWWLACCRT